MKERVTKFPKNDVAANDESVTQVDLVLSLHKLYQLICVDSDWRGSFTNKILWAFGMKTQDTFCDMHRSVQTQLLNEMLLTKKAQLKFNSKKKLMRGAYRIRLASINTHNRYSGRAIQHIIHRQKRDTTLSVPVLISKGRLRHMGGFRPSLLVVEFELSVTSCPAGTTYKAACRATHPYEYS